MSCIKLLIGQQLPLESLYPHSPLSVSVRSCRPLSLPTLVFQATRKRGPWSPGWNIGSKMQSSRWKTFQQVNASVCMHASRNGNADSPKFVPPVPHACFRMGMRVPIVSDQDKPQSDSSSTGSSVRMSTSPTSPTRILCTLSMTSLLPCLACVIAHRKVRPT